MKKSTKKLCKKIAAKEGKEPRAKRMELRRLDQWARDTEVRWNPEKEGTFINPTRVYKAND